MGKHCQNCGMMKKTTFNCINCRKVVCLDCYEFISGLCSNCVTLHYNEKYKTNIDKYTNEEKHIEV